MNKYSGIPELLERFMEEEGRDERWVTVQELRERFGLGRYQGNTISGFLRRLEYGPFGRFPYTVAAITRQEAGDGRPNPRTSRYLLTRRGPHGTGRCTDRGKGTVHGEA